ncbi:Ig-like domain-containing protein [Myxococcaceae bacterium JPH2]|nr:Ig-like domain-containing protein [Myxococcaceae bacterium JPH2]
MDEFDCRDKGSPGANKVWACVENKCEAKTLSTTPPEEDAGTDAGVDAGTKPDSGTDAGTDAGVTCSPACATGEVCDISSGHGVCKTCTDSATGNGQDNGCSAAAPICNVTGSSGKGVCTACQDSATGGAQDNGCSAAAPVCDPAANGGVGACKGCQDSATGNGQDTGCSATAPLCDATANNGVGACTGCQDSATGTGQDTGCAATAPVCDPTATNGAGACTACQDSATGNGQDTGCSATAPLCDATANNGVGACKACQDSATGNGQDTGCSATAPLCDATANNGVGACTACQDSATGNGQDTGCSATAPVCDPTAKNGAGACKACVDSATGNGQDTGCGAQAPVCDTTANSGSGVCKACVDSATGAGQDTGCGAAAPMCDVTGNGGAGVCKACVDSATGNGQDQGCGVDAPVCDTSANGGAGVCKVCFDSASSPSIGCSNAASVCDATANNGLGVCKVCMDTAATGQDLGCVSPSAICDAAANDGFGVCKVCLGAEGCTQPQTCNASGTACEGCVDNASCASNNPNTPVCNTGATPSQCVECTTADAAKCDASKPACNNNLCGCTSDTQCNAAGSDRRTCDTTANNGRGQCEICLGNAQCTDPNKPVCDNKACICRDNADCSVGLTCDGATKACVAQGPTAASTSAQIQAFKNATGATFDPPMAIDGAYVTYIKPATGADVAGYFLQAEATGPAMFVAASPGTLVVGDRVNLKVGAATTLSGVIKAAGTITGLTVISQGHPVRSLNTVTPAGLTVDRSGDPSTELLDKADTYFGTLVRLKGSENGATASSGSGHVAFTFQTTGINNANLKIRVPDTIAASISFADTCKLTLASGPVWKFTSTTGTPPVTTTQVQASAYFRSELTDITCPAPKAVSAIAVSSSEVKVTFDRAIDAASITDAATQFTFNNGLQAVSATVSGKDVTVKTGEQVGGTSYTVTVANSVKDILGGAVAAPGTATFKGYRVPAVLMINEVNPNVSASRDLIELLVVSGGTTDAITLVQESTSVATLATLPDVNVATGDYIVVHLTPTAAQGDATASETASKSEITATTNFPNAWDFVAGATNLTFSNQVVRLKSASGSTLDAVAFVKSDLTTPPGGYPAKLQALQAEGLWLPADCNGALCTYTTTPTALAVSVEWKAAGSTQAGNSMQRKANTHQASDWVSGAPSFGAANP